MPETEELDEYARAHSTPPDELLERLFAETHEKLAAPQMLTGALEGRFLELLVWATGARRVLEIGTYSGYSALSMAAALPDDGELVTCDVWEEANEVARRYAADSPHGHKIDFRLGPALETIATLDGPFDLVFIDADKTNYANYFHAVLPLLAERGLIVIDNTLWSGRVLPGHDDGSAETKALRELNDDLAADPRGVVVMLSIRDGVTIWRRR
ncbi:MAG TPA: class I SAM-dependent methyltransferase [Thermoleophilaceae bacterium]|nr:class I SAM-dependent methyltransferase [Thermoleophilaceae bacterium]